MPEVRLHPIGSDPRHRRVNIFIGNKLAGSIAFDPENYHEEYDAVVDAFIETPTPPGLPEPE